MNDYFVKNLGIMTPGEQQQIADTKVLVVGCGGLGGSVIEVLVRTGFSNLTVVDGDVFEETNMNRQLLCTTETLGKGKAAAAAERAKLINPDIDIKAIEKRIDDSNAAEFVRGCDIVIDALDNVETRLLLEETCAKEQVVLIHGAVSGWQLQVAVCPPGAGVLEKLYRTESVENSEGKPAAPGGIAMIVFPCAAFEVSEAVKYILGRPGVLYGKVLFFDLITKESRVIGM